MASNITETIAKYNNEQVLTALEKERAAELALIEAAAKYETTTRGLVKAIGSLETQTKASERANAAASKEMDRAVLAELKAAEATETYNARLLKLQEVTAGLSPEQRTLNQFIRETDEAFKSGTIDAAKYADAMATVKQRQAQMTAAAKPAVKGVEELGDGSKRTAAGMLNLSRQMQDVVTGLAGGQSVGMIASQQGAQIYDAFASTPGLFAKVASGAVEMSTSVAGTGLVLAPLIAGYYDLEAAEKAALDAQKQLALANDSSLPLLEKATEDVHKLTEIQKGANKEKLQEIDLENAYKHSLEAANAAHDERIRILSAQLGYTDDLKEVNEDLVAHGKKEVQAISANSSAWATYDQELKDHVQAVADNTQAAINGLTAAKAVKEYTDQLTQSEQDEAAAKRAAAKAAREKAKEDKEAARDAKEYMEWVKHINDAEDKRRASLERSIDALDQLRIANEKATGSEEQRIETAAQASRDKAIAIAQEARTVSDGADEQKRINEELRQALKAINAREVDDLKDAEKKKTKAAKDEAAKRKALMEDEYSNYADLAGGVSDLFESLSESNVAAAKKGDVAAQEALLRQFYASQAAAGVEAAINTALAVSKASTIAPPPFNAVAMAAALASGVAQEVAIASESPPSFSDLPPTRLGGVNGRSTPAGTGAENDTFTAYRDPMQGIRMVVEDAIGRSMPAPPKTRRNLVGPRLASTPVGRLLTADIKRATRGTLI